MSSNSRLPRRSVDAESKKPRVSQKPRPASPTFEEEEAELSDTIKDDLDAGELSDSVRPRVPKTQKQSKKPKDISRKPAPAGNEGEKEVEAPSDEEAEFKIAPALSILRGAAAHHEPDTLEHTSPSQFFPAAFSLFTMLAQMQDLLLDNRYLKKIHPGYNVIASNLYYSILFFIQILRARKNANIIASLESKVLRMFERNFEFETLPVAGPLAGFFELLGSIKLSDPRYTWVSPAVPVLKGTYGKGITADEGTYLIPDVPFLLTLAYELGSAKKAGDEHAVDWIKGTTDTERYVKFGGFEFDHNNVYNSLFRPSFPANSDYPENFRAIQRFMKNAGFPKHDPKDTFDNIEDFLNAKGSMSWFTHLIKQASVEADFFQAKTNLSKIAPSADLSMLTETTWQATSAKGVPAPDDLKSQSPDALAFNLFVKLGPSTNYHHRVVTTLNHQFQIGMSLAYIFHVLQNDGKPSDKQWQSICRTKSDNDRYSGPYFIHMTESFPHDGESYVGNSVLNIAKVNEDATHPSVNFSSLLVEHFFLEKGRRTRVTK
jgi:hypothetical protein